MRARAAKGVADQTPVGQDAGPGESDAGQGEHPAGDAGRAAPQTDYPRTPGPPRSSAEPARTDNPGTIPTKR